MKSLTTTIKAGMWMLLCSLLITACSNEDLLESNPNEYAGKAIQLVAFGPDNHTVSRASVKEEFKAGDIIHISTTFTLIDANNSTSTSTVYSCLKYQSGKTWKEEGTNTFNWPWNATEATFKAYYIPAAGEHKNNSSLKKGDVPINLTDITKQVKGEDPLIATYSGVAAGSSVYLQFNHIFSKVTFTNLEAGEEEEFRLITDCDKMITFTRENSDGLTHTTSAITINNYITNIATDSKEVTFLLPELTQDTEIKLAHKDMSAYHSLKLPKKFDSGKHYIIDVIQLADNYVSDAVKEEDWNKAANEITLTSDGIQQYLHAIQEGEECTINGTQILIANKEEKTVVQICNVNFNNQPFMPVNLRNSIIFQGNGFKIKNLKITNQNYENEPDKKDGAICKALFGRNSGVIKNLVIEKATWETGTTTEKYAGILTGVNYGIIENVTINGVNIDNTPAEYTGLLVGLNSQDISDCRITGDITLNVNQQGEGTVYIGGLAGSSSGSGGISNCEVQGNDSKKKITIKGKNKIGYIGGFAGFAEKINDCSTNMEVSIESVTTATNKLYVGGFVGRAERTELKNNTSIGKVTCLSTLENAALGAFAGSLQNIDVHNCAASGDLSSSSPEANKAQGGFVGDLNAQSGTTSIRYSSTTGNIPTTVGAFAGTAAKGNGTLVINNNFCINQATTFILTGEENATVSDCHQNGIGSDGNSFTSSEAYWTNTPAIYGKDAKGNDILYLKRNSIKE